MVCRYHAEKGAVFLFLTAFVVGAGVNDDGPIALVVQGDRLFMDPIGGVGPVFARRRYRDASDIRPPLGIHRGQYGALAFVMPRPGLCRVGKRLAFLG